jgi:enterochelin esterase-like enzyme
MLLSKSHTLSLMLAGFSLIAGNTLAQAPARGGGGGAPVSQQKRLPLVILPAVPAENDRSFYANNPDIPHGKVETVTYGNAQDQEKKMRVYTPPGYDPNGEKTYPVLYLNHGGGENETTWTLPGSGAANFILDNLIAAGKAKPMILAMPNSSGLASGTPPKLGEDDACSIEYLKYIIPYIDGHYKTRQKRESRAIAGLSMGGFVVLNTGLTHLDTFGELYVLSSGYWPEQVKPFEDNFKALLSDPNINDKFRMPIYFSEGEDDSALKNGMKTLAVFNNYGIRNFWVMLSGGHNWTNWRRVLNQTAQVMFPEP